MTNLEYMEMAYDLNQRINTKLEMVSSLRSMGSTVTQLITGMPHSPNQGHSKLEDTVIKIITLENEINDDIDKLVDLKSEMYTVINSLKKNKYKTVLEQRYLCFREWEEIAVHMHYHKRYIYKLRDKALEALEIPEWAKNAEAE